MINRILALLFFLSTPLAAGSELAIVTHDLAVLRAAAKSSSRPTALLWAGEMVEIRGERHDHLLVYDYRREVGGYVHPSQIQRLSLAAIDGPALLATVRFLRDQPGLEALGIGYAAAFIESASQETLKGGPGIEALDALGTMADRLARRASPDASPAPDPVVLDAHLGVAERHGVRFVSYEHEGRVHLCYDGAAFRRVLAMRSSPEQRERAAIALARAECMAGDLSPLERRIVIRARFRP